MQDYKTEYQRWLNSSAIDEKTRAELLSVKDNEKEQEDRFYTELEFGTAGLRGILGAGTNRMNVYVVRRATAGLAAVISKISPALAARGVAIAYDSRRCSKEFAYEAARTLAVCGIRSFVFSSIHSVPQLSFAVRELWCAAGIVITASHNPPQYNGYKVYWSHGGQVGPELAEKIFESIRRADYFDIDTSSLASVNESQMICTVSDLVDEAYYKKALSLRLNPELMQERGANFRVVYTPLHGAGLVPVTEILKRAGLKKLRVVEEQAQPDGDFPTVAAPNPEDPNAFTLALQLAKKTDAQLLLATDPDSDRLGVICRSKGGKYRPLTGNQIGCLLIYYILTMRRERGELPDDAFVVKSLVSTGLADAICASFGVEMRTFRRDSALLQNKSILPQSSTRALSCSVLRKVTASLPAISFTIRMQSQPLFSFAKQQFTTRAKGQLFGTCCRRFTKNSAAMLKKQNPTPLRAVRAWNAFAAQ